MDRRMCAIQEEITQLLLTVFHVKSTALSEKKNIVEENKRRKQKVLLRKELKEIYNFLKIP